LVKTLGQAVATKSLAICPVNRPASCQTKHLLLDAVAVATEEYAKAAAAFSEQMESTSNPNDNSSRNAVQETRLKVKQARLFYESHVTEHGC